MTAVTLNYELAELPSSQHRAGLAGLVIMLQWLERQPGERKGIAELVDLGAHTAVIRLDRPGLEELFDHVYAASKEEVAESKLRKDKKKAVIPPLREVEVEETDRRGKVKRKTVFYYPKIVPRGAFLLEHDPTGEQGRWTKLWRDTVWSVLRGIPAQRAPYEARANGTPATDAEETWTALSQPDGASDLPSTYFIGAMATTADNVPMKDRNRFLFLLHFWPFVVTIYVPNVVDNDGKREFHGFALAIPDVSTLDMFCRELPGLLRERGAEIVAYRPRDALIDIVEESGLDMLRQLRARLEQRTGAQRTSDLVLGVDVLHLLKVGNNVRILAHARVEPGHIVDEYTRIRSAYRDARFRQARLRALLQEKPWFSAFTHMLCTTGYEQTLGRNSFRRDAREALTGLETNMSDELNDGAAGIEAEEIVYRIVGTFLSRRVSSKHGLSWEQVAGDERKQRDFSDKREKIAKDAFLAIRSRTGADFIEYFAGTLCSVPQRRGEAGYVALTKKLMSDPDEIRTLTLLALSARA